MLNDKEKKFVSPLFDWQGISCMMAQRKESIYVDMAAKKTVKITLRILRIM